MRHAKNRDEVTSRGRCEVEQANNQGIGTCSRSTRSAYEIVATNAKSLTQRTSEGETQQRIGAKSRRQRDDHCEHGLDWRLNGPLLEHVERPRSGVARCPTQDGGDGDTDLCRRRNQQSAAALMRHDEARQASSPALAAATEIRPHLRPARLGRRAPLPPNAKQQRTRVSSLRPMFGHLDRLLCPS